MDMMQPLAVTSHHAQRALFWYQFYLPDGNFFTMSPQESTTMLVDMSVDYTSIVGFQLIAHGSNRLHVSS